MPVAALVDDKIFCLHGGLSPELNTFDQITKIMRPTEIPSSGKKFFYRRKLFFLMENFFIGINFFRFIV